MTVNLTILSSIFNIVHVSYLYILKHFAVDDGSCIVCTYVTHHSSKLISFNICNNWHIKEQVY